MPDPVLCLAVKIDWDVARAISLSDITAGLNEYRIMQIAQFARFEDKYRSALAGHLVEALFKRFLPGSRMPSIHLGPHGKPTFADPFAPDFNLSHSGDWVCGIMGHGSVGIDVEMLQTSTLVIDQVLSPKERRDLAFAPDSAKQLQFTKLWTLKEAHLKALGVGLSDGWPSHLSFEVARDGHVTLMQNNDGMSHQCFMLDHRHVCSICSTVGKQTVPMTLDASDVLPQL